MQLDIKYTTERAKKTFIKLASYVKDLEPVWTKFIDYWKNSVMPSTWNSEGALMEGKKWEPLTKKYKQWKEKNYPGKGMLVLSGKLFNAASGGTGWYQKLDSKKLEIGVQGKDYFYYVSERMKNPRKYFYTTEGDMPARVWKELIDFTTVYLESADDDR